MQVTDKMVEAWLVTNGPDGLCSKVVLGFDNLKREVVATVFGNPDDDSEEAQDMRDRLDTPGDWEGDHWSMSWSFEDGYLNVQRISDLTAALAHREAEADVKIIAYEIWKDGKRDSDPLTYQDLTVADCADGYEARPLIYASDLEARSALVAPPAQEPVDDEISPYEWLAREFERLAILRKMWTANEIATTIRRHDIERTAAQEGR